MKEQELFAVWKETDNNEKKLLEQYEGEHVQLAQKQSNDVFIKIKKTMIWELVVSLVIAPVFLYFIWKFDIFFWIILPLFLAAIIISTWVYRKYLRGMKYLNESSMVESLRKKRVILSDFIKQLNFISIIFSILGFSLGYISGYTEGASESNIELSDILIDAAIVIPILGVFVWLVTKYVYALYGRHLKSIEIIYQDLIKT